MVIFEMIFINVSTYYGGKFHILFIFTALSDTLLKMMGSTDTSHLKVVWTKLLRPRQNQHLLQTTFSIHYFLWKLYLI